METFANESQFSSRAWGVGQVPAIGLFHARVETGVSMDGMDCSERTGGVQSMILQRLTHHIILHALTNTP